MKKLLGVIIILLFAGGFFYYRHYKNYTEELGFCESMPISTEELEWSKMHCYGTAAFKGGLFGNGKLSICEGLDGQSKFFDKSYKDLCLDIVFDICAWDSGLIPIGSDNTWKEKKVCKDFRNLTGISDKEIKDGFGRVLEDDRYGDWGPLFHK